MQEPKIIRNIRIGIENLLLHKMRSFLTMLGVVFGVGSVVAMLAVGEGASLEALEQIRKLGSTNIIISSQKPVEDDAAGTQRVRMSIYGLKYLDYARINESFSDIEKIAPVKLLRQESRLGTRQLELRVVGTTPEWFELVPREIVAGRVLAARDNSAYAPVAVLTEHGARRLLATRHSIGQTVRIGSDNFEVIGIIKSEAGQAQGMQVPDQHIDAYIPLNTAREYFGDTFTQISDGSFTREMVELHQIIAQVNDTDNVRATAEGIERMLELFHPRGDYSLSVPLALLEQAEATKRTFNIVLGSIAGISLLVGGIGIMNIMLASVTERTREIGVRRAIGAKRKQIIVQFLIETVVLSTFGGFIGIIVGISIPQVITYIFEMPTVITSLSIILPLIISVGIGIVFGIYPAANAAKVDPIIALRHE